MDPVKVEQLWLKNAVSEIGALLFFSCNGFPGHSYHGQYARHPSVSEHSSGTNPLGSPMENVSVVSCVEHSKVCFKQRGYMWKTPHVFPSARTMLHHYPGSDNSVIRALTLPFSRAHNNFFFWPYSFLTQHCSDCLQHTPISTLHSIN